MTVKIKVSISDENGSVEVIKTLSNLEIDLAQYPWTMLELAGDRALDEVVSKWLNQRNY